MGKRARKTRWRALDIADDHSDSEESNTNSSAVSSRHSHSNSNGYYSKYSYSSQSTPARRRYNPYDGSTKSTRSSSTTSENKITFNEDEYTRITTPRQDVLFKKGYLNKPKSYHTQTSTGNSTISTGNSTGNGTPDHQSADLDYESQFVFPNGFVDQNGIYYVNSYEPYPLMLFNPPTYYQEFSNTKSKRYSTGSLSESMSPNNEEATSQDLSQSGGEASNSGGVSDYSGGPHVFNMVYPGYYVNDVCTVTDVTNGHHHHPPEPVKKLRKRRERQSSKSIPGDSSEFTDENSGDEQVEDDPLHRASAPEQNSQEDASRVQSPPVEPEEGVETPQNGLESAETRIACDETLKTANENTINSIDHALLNDCLDKKTESNGETVSADAAQLKSDSSKQSLLKPDAEEFVPRTYQPMGPPPHLKMIPPNFMPIPLMPIGEFGTQSFSPHPTFIPPGFPINFIPHHLGQKIFPPAPGFVSYPPVVPEARIEETTVDPEDANSLSEDKERESTATPSHTPVMEENKPQSHSKIIDIATVVSKLEAVKQQEARDAPANATQAIVNESRPFKGTSRFGKPHQNFKKSYYNKYRNSPVRSGESSTSTHIAHGDSNVNHQNYHHYFRHSPVRSMESSSETRTNYRNSPVRHVVETAILQKSFSNGAGDSTQMRHSPERFQKRNGKPFGYQNNHSSPKRNPNPQVNQSYQKFTNVIEKPAYTNGHVNFPKNYSESLRKVGQIIDSSQVNTSPTKAVESLEDAKQEQARGKSNNQWISVSNRKKKKNKNVEDLNADANDDAANESGNCSSDLFESYDPSQLVDVVPPSEVEAEEKRIEDILISIAQTETIEMNRQANIDIPEVSEIEKDIVVKPEEIISHLPTDIEENVEVNVEVEEKVVDLNALQEEERISQIVSSDRKDITEEASKPKKRSKKGTQKPLMKKVIITDIFRVEPTPTLKKVVKKIEENKQQLQVTEAVITEPSIAELVITEPVITEPLTVESAITDLLIPEASSAKELTPEVEFEQPEKKPKKKKKTKGGKTVSTANSTVSDEPFDVLLENSLADENVPKTNDEISLELDKLIQKGMYSSLQEKIRSITTEPQTDDFFKTIDSVISPGKDKPAATLKAPDFNRIFQSTRQFLKPNMVSVEHDNTDIKVDIDDKDTKSCSSTVDTADPSAGLVLGNAGEVQDAPVGPETPVEDDQADKTLYPITQAVKEWMSKTREATPEVEILKSPSTIQKEFGDNHAPDNGLNDLLDSDQDDEEVTLFSSQETLDQERPDDLLEYWENDLPAVVSTKDCDLLKDTIVSTDAIKVCADGKSCDKCRTDSIKEDEGEIEVYESKYGQNAAFLHLQNEMREKQRSNNTPRPGHLPYRAVCCSLQ